MASTKREGNCTPNSVSSWTKRRKVVAKYNKYLKEALAEELALAGQTPSGSSARDSFEGGSQMSSQSSQSNHEIHDHTDHDGLSKFDSDSEVEELGSSGNETSDLVDEVQVNEVLHSDTDSESEFEVGDDNESDGESDDDGDNPAHGIPVSLRVQLAEWASKYKLSHAALRSLLAILICFLPGLLPKDHRKLLQTGSVARCDIKNLAGGQYHYFGIQKQLSSLVERVSSVRDSCCLNLQFNVDGLPLFKSSGGTFWPILCKVLHHDTPTPFVVALFYGLTKPNNLDEYLGDFVKEMLELIENGFEFANQRFQVVLSSIVCDAPARAFLKNIKPHMAYFGCEKCITEGEHLGKLCFPDLNAPLRTDASFNAMLDEDHHHGRTPLMSLPVGLVTQVPRDYMHLVCLGVVKKMIKLWRSSSVKLSRMSRMTYESVSNVHESLCSSIPKEFARSPRALFDHPRWKATEFRTFLLYTGPVALHGNVPDDLFNNFLLLSCGIHILISPTLSRSMNSVAREVLIKFVKHFAQLFGECEIVYNVHNLVHLPDDANIHGPLDNFSAFPYENYLYQLKQMIRKPNFPLQQAILRLREHDIFGRKEPKLNADAPTLKKPHFRGPLPDISLGPFQCYEQVQLKTFFLSTGKRDRGVQIEQDIGVVLNIFESKTGIFLLCSIFESKSSFFHYPFDSVHLGIFLVSRLSQEIKVVNVNMVSAKYVLLPKDEDFVALPLVHTQLVQ